MFKLALETDNDIIRIGDRIEIVLNNSDESKEPIKGTLSNVFKSVWSPHVICIQLAEMKYYQSIEVTRIKRITKL